MLWAKVIIHYISNYIDEDDIKLQILQEKIINTIFQIIKKMVFGGKISWIILIKLTFHFSRTNGWHHDSLTLCRKISLPS